MRILLTNDDGISAPGLAGLYQAVADLGEVTVVAPATPQSATGRAITLDAPVVCERVAAGAFEGVAVAGSPADAVKIAIHHLMDDPPDLVLAGINAGANVGINVFYSGTVAAAAEGAMFDVASVAFSLAGGGPMDFVRAAGLCRWVLDSLLARGLGPGELINVNIPTMTPSGPKGVKVVPQGTSAISETYYRQDAPDGRIIFRLADYYEHGPQDGQTDVSALEDGFITVTPLHSDLTDRAGAARLRQTPWGVPPR